MHSELEQLWVHSGKVPHLHPAEIPSSPLPTNLQTTGSKEPLSSK